MPTDQTKKIIMCIGVGGAGCNIINHMHRQGIKDVILVAANTDEQALVASPVRFKIQLGPRTTGGLGAGANPAVGERAALESKEDIDKMLDKSIKMVFLVAGEGGGTGTGALPVIAERAKKEDGMVVVGVVTVPFNFEGAKKQRIAEEGIRKLQKYCDTLIIIENQRLMDDSNTSKNLSLREAFGLVDGVLYNVVHSVTSPINEPSLINLDFHDVKTMLSGSGYAVIGTGVGEGEERATKAIMNALHAPLLRKKEIEGCSRVLISIGSGMENEITLFELAKITDTLKGKLDNDDLMVIFGHYYAKRLANKIQVSIIASGFPDQAGDKKKSNDAAGAASQPAAPAASQPEVSSGVSPAPNPPSSTHQGHTPPTEDVPVQPPVNNKLHVASPVTKPSDGTGSTLHQRWDHNSIQAQPKNQGDDVRLTDAEIKEMMEVPAYLRKNISLDYRLLNNGVPPMRHVLDSTSEDTTT